MVHLKALCMSLAATQGMLQCVSCALCSLNLRTHLFSARAPIHSFQCQLALPSAALQGPGVTSVHTGTCFFAQRVPLLISA